VHHTIALISGGSAGVRGSKREPAIFLHKLNTIHQLRDVVPKDETGFVYREVHTFTAM